jgi:putative transposase
MFGVASICAVLEFPASTYYAVKKRQVRPCERDVRDAEVLVEIRRVWEKSGKLYGARKVYQQLLREGGVAGRPVPRCAVERLMRAHAMAGVMPRRGRPRTTIPGDPTSRPVDLVRRRFAAPAANLLWVTDLTYVAVAGDRFCYTAFVTDAFSRAIVGWQVAESMHTELALDALEIALWARRETIGTALVHHSDRGGQYTSIRYGQRLADSGIARSVGAKGDSYDNALAESVNALYKKEVIGRRDSWISASEVMRATSEWIHWYNHERLHSWCGHRPPMEYEQTFWQRRPAQPPTAA